MAMYINVVCDDAECAVSQPFWFDKESETFGELLNVVTSQGWGIHGGPGQKDCMYLCSKHNGRNDGAQREVPSSG